MLSDSLLRHRDAVAMLPAIAVFAMLATASLKQIVKLKDRSEAITVSLYEEPPPEEPPPEPQPKPRTLPPPEPPPPRPQPRAAIEPAPVVTQPTDHVAAAPVAPAPAPPAQAPSPPVQRAPAPEPAPRAASESLEAAYVARLRSYLESIKRYPTSREARQQHPQGKVRLWLELARDGTLRGSGVEESSGSMILDGAAQSTVRQGNYPAFPEAMWADKPTHRFAVTLDYLLDG